MYLLLPKLDSEWWAGKGPSRGNLSQTHWGELM